MLPFVFFSYPPPLVGAFEPVQAIVDKETAWTGEAVPIIVTLYSPGPFSGTAAFDLPELPQTVLVKAGGPLVGIEEIEGESYITQRHEFTLYTQRSGSITVPSFRVRFAGKKSFTSDAESMEGMTSKLQFESKRPPGTESMGIVISATAMKIEQSWNPLPESQFNAGDVILRTITRNAEGTTAMMMPPVPDSAPEGVNVYSSAADVQDKLERGDASARRVETMKYQFQRSGRFTLPELTFTWWDPKQQQLQSESLAGLEIVVPESKAAAQQSNPKQTTRPASWISRTIGLIVLVFVGWLIHKPAGRLISAWQSHRNRPEAVAARRLRQACTANDASAAYAALMAWFAARQNSNHANREDRSAILEQLRPLREQCQTLSRDLFSSHPKANQWDGSQLWATFSEVRQPRSRTSGTGQPSALPALNPSTTDLHDSSPGG